MAIIADIGWGTQLGFQTLPGVPLDYGEIRRLQRRAKERRALGSEHSTRSGEDFNSYYDPSTLGGRGTLIT